MSHSGVRVWKQYSPKAVGYWANLYTRHAAGEETDEIETWLKREFEDPAADALGRATSDARLTPRDWNCLVRFLAAQMLRTPAFFARSIGRWQAAAPRLLESALRDSVEMLKSTKGLTPISSSASFPNKDFAPIRVTASMEPGKSIGQLRASVVVGRGLWLFHMRSLLTGAAKVLHDHRWSILRPCEGLTWFTSDDPVVRLNYRSNNDYDFNGGINRQCGEILFPLGPRHLLYTQIGSPRRPPKETLSRELTDSIRRIIAQHAFRMIFAAAPDEKVAELRPRVVNDDQFRKESEWQRNWHKNQTDAERALMG